MAEVIDFASRNTRTDDDGQSTGDVASRNTRTDDDGQGTGDVATWLRALADRVEAGKLGDVGAAVVIMRDDRAGEGGFCLRSRSCNMDFIARLGALKLMMYDMMSSDD